MEQKQSIKTVEAVITPAPAHFVGDGFRVHNFIPSAPGLDMKRMDPFIMLDYNSKFNFPASNQPKGVGVHPHRGFETVTVAYSGKVEHHDSSGGGGVIGEGEVQWMTAASGVLHKEFHEQEWSRQGGIFQMVQLWVNLPAKDKMSVPKYQALTRDNIVTVPLHDNGSEVRLIAGHYNGLTGPASTFSPMNMMNVHLKKGVSVSFSFPANYNTGLLIIEGSVTINHTSPAPTDHFVLMSNDGTEFTIEATDDAVVLVLSGEPLNEPIAAHGPFVMNTRDEIVQAFHDFQQGKFGYLED